MMTPSLPPDEKKPKRRQRSALNNVVAIIILSGLVVSVVVQMSQVDTNVDTTSDRLYGASWSSLRGGKLGQDEQQNAGEVDVDSDNNGGRAREYSFTDGQLVLHQPAGGGDNGEKEESATPATEEEEVSPVNDEDKSAPVTATATATATAIEENEDAKDIEKSTEENEKEIGKSTVEKEEGGDEDPKDEKGSAEEPAKQQSDDENSVVATEAEQSNEKQAAAAIARKKQKIPIKKYSLENALSIFDVYDAGAALFVYDPPTDKFLALYPDGMGWEESRFIRIRDAIFNSLRLLLPDRFTSESPEFVVPIASRDYPHVNYNENECFMKRNSSKSCVPDDFPPVLQFGSVFQDSKMPSTIAMPMPEKNHLGCFHHWIVNHEVCKLYKPKGPGNPLGLVFGDNVGLEWDDLIPQVLWRATDRGFLTKMIPELRRPDFEKDVLPKLNANPDENVNVTATKAMREVYDELVPRWKGVVWTAEAEREAEQSEADDLPWVNIKYATTMYMKGVDDSEYYNKFVEHGIPAIGEPMDLETLAKYKYHMDIGGGGGTTWSGTLEKLAMPGLLFHHVSPTRDYNHDLLEPWVHYVPLREDLTDLRERYDWAESHPEEAREISQRSTALIRSLGTDEGFEGLYREFYEAPLREVVDAYEPLSGGDDDTSWREFVQRRKGKGGLRPMVRCGGRGGEDDCEEIAADVSEGASEAPISDTKAKEPATAEGSSSVS